MRNKSVFLLLFALLLLSVVVFFGVSNNVLIWISIFLCFFEYAYFHYKKIKQEQEYTVLENELLKNSYFEIKNQYEVNSKLYHDMRNHFSILQAYLNERKIEDAQIYLKQLQDNNDLAFAERWTGVDIVDYILSQAQHKAKRSDIKVEIHAEYPQDCKINPVDLCTILTNVINNAFDACYNQKDDSEKKISLTIRRIHQFILIRVINTTDHKPIMKSGKLVTTKQDVLKHGWGTKCINSAVEKYQGTIKYEYIEPYFSVSIMMFYQ